MMEKKKNKDEGNYSQMHSESSNKDECVDQNSKAFSFYSTDVFLFLSVNCSDFLRNIEWLPVAFSTILNSMMSH